MRLILSSKYRYPEAQRISVWMWVEEWGVWVSNVVCVCVCVCVCVSKNISYTQRIIYYYMYSN